MRFVTILAALLMAPVQAQENTAPTPDIVLKPAVRKTATVSNNEYRVARDENNKFIFIAPAQKEIIVNPLLIEVEIEKQ
jgi:hypothetical protein